jgi:hypothetical protein
MKGDGGAVGTTGRTYYRDDRLYRSKLPSSSSSSSSSTTNERGTILRGPLARVRAWPLTLFSVKLVNVTFPLGLTTRRLRLPWWCPSPLDDCAEAAASISSVRVSWWWSSCSGWETVFAVAVVAAAMVGRSVVVECSTSGRLGRESKGTLRGYEDEFRMLCTTCTLDSLASWSIAPSRLPCDRVSKPCSLFSLLHLSTTSSCYC